MVDAPANTDGDGLVPGTRVEVRDRFSGTWSRGFSVEAVDPTGVTLRRRSDDQVLPGTFPPQDVRKERKSMWWV